MVAMSLHEVIADRLDVRHTLAANVGHDHARELVRIASRRDHLKERPHHPSSMACARAYSQRPARRTRPRR